MAHFLRLVAAATARERPMTLRLVLLSPLILPLQLHALWQERLDRQACAEQLGEPPGINPQLEEALCATSSAHALACAALVALYLQQEEAILAMAQACPRYTDLHHLFCLDRAVERLGKLLWPEDVEACAGEAVVPSSDELVYLPFDPVELADDHNGRFVADEHGFHDGKLFERVRVRGEAVQGHRGSALRLTKTAEGNGYGLVLDLREGKTERFFDGAHAVDLWFRLPQVKNNYFEILTVDAGTGSFVYKYRLALGFHETWRTLGMETMNFRQELTTGPAVGYGSRHADLPEVSARAWHHLVVVHSGKELTVLLDGERYGRFPIDPRMTTVKCTGNLVLGPTSHSAATEVDLDEVRIYRIPARLAALAGIEYEQPTPIQQFVKGPLREFGRKLSRFLMYGRFDDPKND